MKEIQLTRGAIATVSDCDYDYLTNNFKWRLEPSRSTSYASCTHKTEDGVRRTLKMHRLIMMSIAGPLTPDVFIDHIDHNGLNNTRENLRLATNTQNLQCSRIYKNNSTGYRGVSWAPHMNRFVSKIRVNKKLLHLGYFDNTIDAAKAYNKAAKEHFGEFASLNIIE